MSKTHQLSPSPKDRAFLVGTRIVGDKKSFLTLEDSMNELYMLAQTAGLEVVGEISQNLKKPNANTLVGSGKVEEIKMLVEETLSDIIIFDDELNPRHQRELEKIFDGKARVIDRTTLILDIFAQHAQTREGILQVELAQYEYRLPRLTRAWTHLARQAGGGGGRAGSTGGVGLRGPGETQLEIDRREIGKKISQLKKELDKVRAHRSRHRANRKKSNIPLVALVGYTNAGKSTLINQLSNASVYVADKLFATLDPTTRKVEVSPKNQILVTDTVGFIQKLPTQLVAAFRATLEEISEADLLIHIVDCTHPNFISHYQSVNATLNDIDAGQIPVLTVLNKVDLLPDPNSLSHTIKNHFPDAFPISAISGEGCDKLLSGIEESLFEAYIPLQVELPYSNGRLIALFHNFGHIKNIEHGREKIIIEGFIPGRYYTQFASHIAENPAQKDG
ncbi:MAG: GTPase HflX [Bacteroidales bacterium]|nr:GTPase HflX [Bacteroidales bacterium]